MKRELPVWRSLMYVPVNVEKIRRQGAHARRRRDPARSRRQRARSREGERARTLVEKAAARVRRGGADVVVRINRPLSLAVRDLEHSI